MSMEYNRWKQTLCVFRRCRLCRFRFEEGDKVGVVTLNGWQSETFTYSYRDVQFSHELGRPIFFCSEACELGEYKYIGRDELAIGCHSDCIAFVNKLSPSPLMDRRGGIPPINSESINYSGLTVADGTQKKGLDQIYSRSEPDKKKRFSLSNILRRDGKTTRSSKSPVFKMFTNSIYWYEPPISEETRRWNYLINRLGRTLRNELDKNGKLSQELWIIIAQYLSREYAISLVLPTPYCGRSAAFIEKDIWAKHVYIDGKRYISELSNFPGHGRELIQHGQEKSPDNLLHVMEDHLGIRKLFISATPPLISPSDGTTWWRLYQLSQWMEELSFESDGTKLQFPENLDSRRYCFSKPIGREELRDQTHSVLHTRLTSSKLTPVLINEPDIKGYSACWTKSSTARGALLGIHAHKQEEGLEFYRRISQGKNDLVWTYLALKPGELLSYLWCKTGVPYYQATIVLNTTMGRTLILGPHPLPHPVDDFGTLTILSRPWVDKPDVLWVDTPSGDDETVTEIVGAQRNNGMEGSSVIPADLAALPLPSFWNPDPKAHMDLFHTQTSLEDVVNIVPCRERKEGNSFISGLLFRFRDGHESAIGSFRFDWTEESILVASGSSGLFLGFGHVQGRRRVVEVAISPQDNYQLVSWEKFPWRGNLLWWFNSSHMESSHSEP